MTKYRSHLFIFTSTTLICSLLSIAVLAWLGSRLITWANLPPDYWLGRPDIPNFALLTLPYSLIVAGLGLYAYQWLSAKHVLVKAASSFLLGATLANLWTIVASLIMWPLMREIELPIIFPWIVGGVFSSALTFWLNARILPRQQPVSLAPLGLTQIGLLLFGTPLVGIILLNFVPFFVQWTFMVEPVVYLLPQGYQGPILVVFDQANGQPKHYEGRARVYEIPESGVLLTQFSPYKQIYQSKFWYVDANGKRTQLAFNINSNLDWCARDISAGTVGVCPTWTQSHHPAHEGYLVGYLNDLQTRRTYSSEFDILFDKVVLPLLHP